MVCRRVLPTLRTLKSHCRAAHSKLQLINVLLKNPRMRFRMETKSSFERVQPEYLKCEILYLEDGFENPFPAIKIKKEHDEDDKTEIKRFLEEEAKKRKQNLLKLRNFRFDKSLRKKYTKSLDDQTGTFYFCQCAVTDRKNNPVEIFRKSDIETLNSDTDSCSETGKFYLTLTDFKYYCDRCGNGYKTKAKLVEHLDTHNKNCHICSENFEDEFEFKGHMKKHLLKVFVCYLCEAEFGYKNMLLDHLDAHIEDDVYENVLGLEQDYKIFFGPV